MGFFDHAPRNLRSFRSNIRLAGFTKSENEANVSRSMAKEIRKTKKREPLRDTLDLLVLHQGFNDDVRRIRGELGIKDDELAGAEGLTRAAAPKSEEELERHFDLQAKLNSPARELLKKYHLPSNFHAAIRLYIRWGTTRGVMTGLSGYQVSVDSFEENPVVSIKMFRLLSAKEWREAQQMANVFFARHYPEEAKRRRGYKNIDRDIAGYTALEKSADKGYRDLVTKIYVDSKDISREADSRRAKRLKKAQERLRKRFKERFGDIK